MKPYTIKIKINKGKRAEIIFHDFPEGNLTCYAIPPEIFYVYAPNKEHAMNVIKNFMLNQYNWVVHQNEFISIKSGS